MNPEPSVAEIAAILIRREDAGDVFVELLNRLYYHLRGNGIDHDGALEQCELFGDEVLAEINMRVKPQYLH